MLIYQIITSIFVIPFLFVIVGIWIMSTINMIKGKGSNEDNFVVWLISTLLSCISINAYAWVMLQ